MNLRHFASWMMLGGALSVLSPQPVLAHGTDIGYQATDAIAITAMFDSGEPLAEAQVLVYSPNDPSTPWKQGMTDQQGQFVFVPDGSIPGNWEVQVRQAGHGDILIIPISESADRAFVATADSSSGLTGVQKGILIGSVIWGCVGTALYFSSRKPKATSQLHSVPE